MSAMTMRSIVLLLLCGLASLPAAAAGLIGKTVPPYPDGMSSATGTCVSDVAGLTHVCDYGIAVVDDAKGLPRWVIAQQSLGYRGKLPIWRVLDALKFPALQKNEQLAIGSCHLNGAGTIVAVVSFRRDQQGTKAVRKAWRLDFATKRLLAIPTSGVDCVNEGEAL